MEWEDRQRRPRQVLELSLLGAVATYAATSNVAASLGAGAIGAALGNQPLTLGEALRRTFSEKGLRVVNFYRLGRFAAKILFLFNGVYWTLESHTPTSAEATLEDIEDWLYGDLVKQVDDLLGQDDMRLRP